MTGRKDDTQDHGITIGLSISRASIRDRRSERARTRAFSGVAGTSFCGRRRGTEMPRARIDAKLPAYRRRNVSHLRDTMLFERLISGNSATRSSARDSNSDYATLCRPYVRPRTIPPLPSPSSLTCPACAKTKKLRSSARCGTKCRAMGSALCRRRSEYPPRVAM